MSEVHEDRSSLELGSVNDPFVRLPQSDASSSPSRDVSFSYFSSEIEPLSRPNTNEISLGEFNALKCGWDERGEDDGGSGSEADMDRIYGYSTRKVRFTV